MPGLSRRPVLSLLSLSLSVSLVSPVSPSLSPFFLFFWKEKKRKEKEVSFCGCAQCFFWHLYFLCVYVLCCVLCFEEEEEEGEHANVLSLSREREHKRNNNTPLKFERHFDFEFFGWFSCFFREKKKRENHRRTPIFVWLFFLFFWLGCALRQFVLFCAAKLMFRGGQ